MLPWVLPSVATSILWGLGDVIAKYIMNAGVDYRVLYCIGGMIYFLLIVIYFFINKDVRQKIYDLKNIKYDKKNLTLLFIGFALFWAIGEVLINYSYSKTKNIGYVRSIVVTSALVMYLYSLFFMNAEFNKYTCLGIIFVMIGIFLIVNFSGKN